MHPRNAIVPRVFMTGCPGFFSISKYIGEYSALIRDSVCDANSNREMKILKTDRVR